MTGRRAMRNAENAVGAAKAVTAILHPHARPPETKQREQTTSAPAMFQTKGAANVGF